MREWRACGPQAPQPRLSAQGKHARCTWDIAGRDQSTGREKGVIILRRLARACCAAKLTNNTGEAGARLALDAVTLSQPRSHLQAHSVLHPGLRQLSPTHCRGSRSPIHFLSISFPSLHGALHKPRTRALTDRPPRLTASRQELRTRMIFWLAATTCSTSSNTWSLPHASRHLALLYYMKQPQLDREAHSCFGQNLVPGSTGTPGAATSSSCVFHTARGSGRTWCGR